jgi:hypothetical protein
VPNLRNNIPASMHTAIRMKFVTPV